MPLTAAEELILRTAFNEIARERKESLRAMFTGARLVSRSKLADAKTVADEVKAVKKKLEDVPGISVPKLGVPSLNLKIFEGIDLRALVDFRIPTLSLPDVDLSWVPDIRLGSLPGFSLPKVRLNLKGILKYKDLLPNISLRALAYALAVKWPNINFPSLMLDLSRIIDINLDILCPGWQLAYPEFFDINLDISLPHLGLPDINLPTLPSVDLPDVNLGNIRLPDLPGFDLPKLVRLPGFDKVLRLLFELFDVVDIGEILGELGIEFLTDFVSSALPIVQQVKSGAGAAKSWGTAAHEWHKARKTAVHREFLLPGNARDACDAVAVLLRDSRDQHAAMAAIQTTQLAVSTAGMFADLGGVTGPATAAAAAFAKACHKIMIMGARYKEMKKVNQVLTTTPEEHLCSNIFEISPLLGCYYLANNTTSSVLNILCENILEDGWMAQWEVNKRKHLDPLIRDSQRFILESRYVLEPIRQNKGMYKELGFTEKLKQGAALYVKKKIGRAGAHERVATHKYIG